MAIRIEIAKLHTGKLELRIGDLSGSSSSYSFTKEEVLSEIADEIDTLLKNNDSSSTKSEPNTKEALMKEAMEVAKGNKEKAIELLFSEDWNPTFKYLDVQDTKEETKIELYCKKPECFNHYLARHKIKSVKETLEDIQNDPEAMEQARKLADIENTKSKQKGCGEQIRNDDSYGWINCGDILDEDEKSGKVRLCNKCQKDRTSEREENNKLIKEFDEKFMKNPCGWDVECGKDGYLCSHHKDRESVVGGKK